MKIGNITFQWSYNCGSILQCMGLRTVLERAGHDVTVVNFSSPGQRQLYSVYYPWSTPKNVIKNILCFPGRKVIEEHYRQYKQYIMAQFGYCEEPQSSSDSLRESLPPFDLLVAGGDQIWNVRCLDFHPAYLLDFAETGYKISYSPSLGATDIGRVPEANRYAGLLKGFDGISCREPNGARRLEKLLGQEVPIVLDPTMLLSADDWRSQVARQSIPFRDGGFIFYYAFSYSKQNNMKVQELAEQLDMPVVILDAKQWYIKRLARYKNFVLSRETGPEAFLKYVDRSAVVVTTSFHGTAFSVIFRKRFVYIENPRHEAGDDRTSFLLERLGIEDRSISADALSLERLTIPVDYGTVFEKLAAFRRESLDYLNGHLDRAGDVR